MKRGIIAIAVILSGMVYAGNEGNKGNVDSKTTVKWKGEKVTGEHWGFVSVKESSVEVEDGMLSAGVFTMDMNSITVEDIEAGSSYNKKLVGHLKSDDFFGVEAHPTSKFEITKVIPLEGNKYRITGKLTIKGIEQMLSFPAVIEIDNGMLHAEATLTIDRTKFDVRYGSETFFGDLKDKAIYDEFEMTLDIHAEI